MCTLWQSTSILSNLLLLSLLQFTSQASQYFVECSDSGTALYASEETNNSPLKIEQVVIPINTASRTCTLHVILSSTEWAFEPESQCTLSFIIEETNTEQPTEEPTFIPTVNPTVEPTTVPSFSPVTSTTVEPTASPAAPESSPSPTSNPSLSPSSPSRYPTSNPSQTPTVPPTLEPTMEPTNDPTNDNPGVDNDELILWHMLHINDDNIFWKSSYDEEDSVFFQTVPECEDSINGTFAEDELSELLGPGNDDVGVLKQLFTSGFDGAYPSQNITIPITFDGSPIHALTPFFPNIFSFTSNDTFEFSSFTVDINTNNTDMYNAEEFTCLYGDTFESNETIASDIEYYLFADNNTVGMFKTNLIVDITIVRECIHDPTPVPTNMPTTTPTESPFPFDDFTSTFTETEATEDEGVGEIWGVAIETIVSVAAAGGVLLIAVVVVVVCLVRRKSILEDSDEEAIIRLKEPKTHDQTKMITNKFMVTEEDHAEMVQLARQNSLSTGLEA